MKIILNLMAFVASLNIVFGQEKLSLEMAQNIALENNFGLKIAEKQIEIADYQIFKGNAGMLPTLDFNSSLNGSVNQVHQKYLDGRDIQRFGNSYTPASSLSMSWTLYDGKRRVAVMDKLKTYSLISKKQKQLLIQNTLAEVMQLYYEIAKFQQNKEYLNLILSSYQSRLNITNERWQCLILIGTTKV